MIAGIDLGTTNSLIGVYDSGFPTLLADREGNRLTPSVVFYGEKGEVLVGREATRMHALRPSLYPPTSTIRNAPRRAK
ncbi:MAG: Hsp70 family protein [Verrucomicrobia bacterium]|nr:Hsp70 family protein [Verrucomicrobiota bacterium]